jgi:hypothetical protein
MDVAVVGSVCLYPSVLRCPVQVETLRLATPTVRNRCQIFNHVIVSDL